MTEWMFQDVCDVEEWYVCSSSSHQARCDVALDMGHSRPAGHKWAQGSPHDDKWVWTGCYAGVVPAGRAGRWAGSPVPGALGTLAWPAGVYCTRFGGRREGTRPFRHPIGIGYPECIFHIRPSAFK
jgi:hypothetical protein